MADKLIDTLNLENGLTLNLMDNSRKIAGDRYVIRVTARISIDVDEKWFTTTRPPVPVSVLREKLGDKVVFTQTHERNFIDENERIPMTDSFADRFRTKSATYFAHPDFAWKFILRQYNELPEVKYGPSYRV
ncbi:MAG: hypothetical protein HKM93_05085 [Desulfobacteraceae bacterium]|nr:hypothetical protein [Desulfobacteraceae bacterium]